MDLYEYVSLYQDIRTEPEPAVFNVVRVPRDLLGVGTDRKKAGLCDYEAVRTSDKEYGDR